MSDQQASASAIKLRKKKAISDDLIGENITFLNELISELDGDRLLFGHFKVSGKGISDKDGRMLGYQLRQLEYVLRRTSNRLEKTISYITDAGGMVEFKSEIDGHVKDSRAWESAILTILSNIGYGNKNVSFDFKTSYGFYAYVWFMLMDIFECQSNQERRGYCPSWWNALRDGAYMTTPERTYELRTLIVALEMMNACYAGRVDNDEENMSLGTITLEQARALGVRGLAKPDTNE